MTSGYPFGGKYRKGGYVSLFVPVLIAGGFFRFFGRSILSYTIICISCALFVLFLIDFFKEKRFYFNRDSIKYGKTVVHYSDILEFEAVSKEEILVVTNNPQVTKVIHLHFDEIYYKEILQDIKAIDPKYVIGLRKN